MNKNNQPINVDRSKAYDRHVLRAKSFGLAPLDKKQFAEAADAHVDLKGLSGPRLEARIAEIVERRKIPDLGGK
jgi:hypothetical protein